MFTVTYTVGGVEYTSKFDSTMKMISAIVDTTARFFPDSDPLASWAQITIKVTDAN